jgi:hypothetical protein
MAFRAMGIGIGLLALLVGAGLMAMGFGYLPFSIFPLFGIVSGGIFALLGLVLMYKGVSRKEAKEEI